jgi:hypothetical protein
LSIEETRDEEDEVPRVPLLSANMAPISLAQAKPSTVELYELVEEHQTDLAFQVFCFF